VVIKVQRASVERVVETDLEIMYDVARLLEARTGWGKFYKLVEMVDEFARSIREELNYIVEARNAQRLADNMKSNPRIRIPKVYWEFSTRRVLILEFVAGIKITSAQDLDEAGINTAEVGRMLANSILKQILYDGFFHADPHPGNVSVDQEQRIVFMDFGMVGRLDEWMKEKLGAMLFNIVRKDVNGIVRVLIEIGDPQKKVHKQGLKRDIYRLFDKYYNRPLEEIKIGHALRELLGMSFVYRIRVPVELVLMIRCLILLEGAVECLAPDVSIVELAEPFGKKLMREKLGPRRLGQALQSYLLELSAISFSFPRHLDNLVQTLEEGDLKVTLEHQNFNKLISRLNLVGNRISFSLIVASIIVGSSLIAQRSPQSLLWRFPIAEGGFVIAVLLGLWLLISIIRSRKI
jgi:ubiquinone biosynthesis protein